MTMYSQDVTLVAGDSVQIAIPVYGDSVDLTGYTARWWLGRSAKSRGNNVLVKKSSAAGITIENASTAPTVVVTLDAADTVDLRAGVYFHEAEVTDLSGRISTILQGAFTLRAALVE